MKTLLHIQMNIGHLLQRAVEEELAPFGLHHGQGRALMFILREAPVTQAELSRLMNVKAATVTNMLKPLEQQGLIQRRNDPVTNRALLVSLTPEGEVACEQVRNAWEQVEKRIRSGLTQQELETTFPTLEKVLVALGGTVPQNPINSFIKRKTS